MKNEVDMVELKKYYSLLNGIRDTLDMYYQYVPDKLIYQYNGCVNCIYVLTYDNNISDFKIEKDEKDHFSGGSGYHVLTLSTKIVPLLKYLKDIYINDDITKIGILYSNIENTELQKRCLDILSSKDAFDRVINQATQVLETAIKKKANLEDTKLTGLNLVSKVIAPKKENTILLFSENPELQEAYAFLYKGIIGAYRNPTHHTTDYVCTRQDALKVCGFIDFLLKELEHSKNIKSS